MSQLTAKPPRLSKVEMIQMVLPNEANPFGNMLGGKVLHFIDLVAAMAAMRHAGKPCVTASFDSVDFINPIHIGEACVLNAQVTWTGRTSLEVYVQVYAQHMVTGERRRTTTAFTTFVAFDPETNRPTEVPPLLPETEEEKRLFESAAARRAERLARRRHELEAAEQG